MYRRKRLLEGLFPPLKCVSFIYHLIWFKKDQTKIQVLLDPVSKINVMSPAYMAKLDLKDWPTNLGALKINVSTLEMFEMVLASFWVDIKLNRVRFFQEIFSLAIININVVFGPTNDQTSADHWLEKICGSSLEANQWSFYCLYSLFELKVENLNLSNLKNPDCFISDLGKLLF